MNAIAGFRLRKKVDHRLLSQISSITVLPPVSHSRRIATMAPYHYDVLFIGSGQSANPLAKAFANAGHRTGLIERSSVGGTCVNVGCTPTKTMIASGRVAYLASRGAEYGVHGGATDGVTVDMKKVRERKRNIVAQWHEGSERGLEKAGVECMFGEGSFVGEKEVLVKCEGGRERLVSADTIFISTGERPAKPDVPGLNEIDTDRVLDSTTIMELDAVPKHLVVLGGGYIGLEFGQLFRRFGAEVTVVQRAKQLVPREDEDVAAALLDVLKEDGLTVHLASNVESVSKSVNTDTPLTVNVATSDGKLVIEGSHILVAAGRIPNTDMLNLNSAGVETTPKGHVVVNDRLETTAKGIYALGDVHGGPAFTHMSYDDFRIIRTNLLSSTLAATHPRTPTTTSSPSRVLAPYVMFTDPQLAHIGLHERDFASTNRSIKTATMPMSYVARAAETAETRGLMKAAVDAETGEILGFTCLGIEGGEVMAVVQIAMMGGLKWWDLEGAVLTHPSLSESLNNLWAYLK
ncbi:pyridine nucleotide-disulfide oxidoreductase domain-containing protein [Sarocladium implicatum]|nr:pyridine nucleotide-disulfide oxidoreductase domain-containing protein [Sarocladium implicatum]